MEAYFLVVRGQAFFKRAQTTAIKGADDRMTRGVYLGHHERAGATLLLTPDGVRRGIGITQLPADQKFDSAFLASCKGLPWVPNPKERKAPAALIEEAVGHAAPIPPPEPVGPSPERRR